ncbi:GNAT family N-acetyltransferase [Nocardioides sp. ChNu-99]|uniref:GNAT family N-acetyltransferase n=1 Tax=Nocardioides sp. ChNu-99 TaxID=2839897 RepID=UPI00240749A6|nr:GNAT family N-acetyltransferase [Nocardioides sp. ChNu-99]MDF9716417.1 GNAT family N-acetyltransferase [Nocardioides sp. ChNu-99]
MTPPDEPQHAGTPAAHDLGAHGLGPHVVGTRVVVRRVVPGQVGPTGGPSFTDVLGVAEQWSPSLVVRRADGTRVEVPHDLIVSGKPVPPRPSPRLRVDAGAAEARMRLLWPGTERERLEEWVLQASSPTGGRLRRRTNSVLAAGTVDLSPADARAHVADWYAARERRPLAMVVVGSAEEELFRDGGWHEPVDVDGWQVALQLASLAQVRRALARRGASPYPDLTVAETHRDEHLVVLDAAVEVEEPGGERVVLARGGAAVRGDWAGLHDLAVEPAYRRAGRGTAVLAALVDELAALGATTLALHVLTTNAPALALYEGLGFVTHHTVTYLAPPD